ncbi:MarR family winged helix-turn-helix transcriptional regulator [Baekduia soli]|nr:MarR family transcriptional regulator [Baekduia soli]
MTSPPSAPIPAPDRLQPEELQAWRGMLQVHARLTAALDDDLRRQHGLSVPGYEVLMFVGDAEEGQARMADLADRVLLSRSGLTRLVDRLVADGLLQRRACEDDGRGSFAQITPDGRRRLQDARRTHLDGVRRLFLEHVGAAEQRQLGALWERVLAAI